VAGACVPLVAAEKPLFTFGAIADIQYADSDTNGPRQYRRSIEKLERCGAALRGENPVFTVQLGDLVDGGIENLDRILPLFRTLPGKLYSTLGNHDFCAPRPELLQRLGMPAAYYEFVQPGWRFLVMDGMSVSVMGRPESDPRHAEAARMLAVLKQSGAPNAQPWDGALGREQRDWLRKKLAEAARRRERAVVFCHFPVLPQSCRPPHLLWDYQETLAILDAAPAMAAWIAGHDHRGGYAQRNGIHYLTLPGLVEHEAGQACQTVDVFPSRLTVRTAGEASGRTLPLR
jgi:hypothetical protein